MELPKELRAPDLLTDHLDGLTMAVFGPEVPPRPCDVLFVFGGTHPGRWETTIRAYQAGYASRIVVTGGVKPGGRRHPQWDGGDGPEAPGIVQHLIRGGVPSSAITWEEASRNSLENVRCAAEIFDFAAVRSVMFVSMSHGAGRQHATLLKVLPSGIDYVPFTFDAEFSGVIVSRQGWAKTSIGRDRVWGEYLRMRVYGARGDIADVAPRLRGLEDRVRPFVATQHLDP